MQGLQTWSLEIPATPRLLARWAEARPGGGQAPDIRGEHRRRGDELRNTRARSRRIVLDPAAGGADSGRVTRPTGAIRLRLIFGTATLMGILTGFQAYYYITTFNTDPKHQASLLLLLPLNLNYWYSWALLTPGVLWLARRFPLERATWMRSVPVHIVGVFLCTLTHVALVIAGRAAIHTWWGTWRGDWVMQFREMFFL